MGKEFILDKTNLLPGAPTEYKIPGEKESFLIHEHEN